MDTEGLGCLATCQDQHNLGNGKNSVLEEEQTADDGAFA